MAFRLGGIKTARRNGSPITRTARKKALRLIGTKTVRSHTRAINKNGVPDGLWTFWDENGEAVNPLF
jgi:hypothetical protein